MNNEEKKKLVDEACDLFNEAIEKVKKAKALLKKCGMNFCCGIDEERNCIISSNLQMSKGIHKLCDITGVEPYFHRDIYDGRKIDRSRKYITYRGLVFLQLASEINNTASINYTFE
jgi:hypothetical protein